MRPGCPTCSLSEIVNITKLPHDDRQLVAEVFQLVRADSEDGTDNKTIKGRKWLRRPRGKT